MKFLLAILLFLTGFGAQAASCLNFDSGWTSQYYQGSIQFAMYRLDDSLMQIVFFDQSIQTYVPVATAIAQNMQYMTNPTPYYLANFGQLHEALLGDSQTYCPLRTEAGGILLTR
jgi:hypothetical protein